MLMKRTFISLGLSSLLFGHAVADEKLDVSKRAEPIKRTAPKYPGRAGRSGLEGWVQVSFVVDEEGNVTRPILHDSSGHREFENATLRAVKRWKYEPAIVDGKAVEQCHNKVQVDFRLNKPNKGVTRKFKSKFTEGTEAIANGELEVARQIITDLKGDTKRNWAENSYYWVLQVMYAEKIGAEKYLESALLKISSNGRTSLPDDLYLQMLEKLFIVSIKSNQLAQVIDTYQLIESIFPESKVRENLQPYYEQVQGIVSSEQPLHVSAVLENNQIWSHKLLRNKFELISKNNPVDRVEIRCANKYSVYTSVKENGFTIPQSWGQCDVYVSGGDGTQFDLFELKSI